MNNCLAIAFVFLILLLPHPACARDYDSGPRLVAYFNFDDDARDYTGWQIPGTAYGPYFVKGISGQAYYFDGINDYIDLGLILTEEIRDGFTISVWIKLEEGALIKPHNYIFWKQDDQPGIRVTRDQIVFTAYHRGEGCCMVSRTRLREGQWYYIAYAFNGSTFNGYIDGKFEVSQPNCIRCLSSFEPMPAFGTEVFDSRPWSMGDWGEEVGEPSAGTFTPGGRLLIGADEKKPSAWRHFQGIIDEVKIWNYALSEEEIRLEYERVIDGF